MLAHGISGTVKWMLDKKGILFFEPVNGDEGTFADAEDFEQEWGSY